MASEKSARMFYMVFTNTFPCSNKFVESSAAPQMYTSNRKRKLASSTSDEEKEAWRKKMRLLTSGQGLTLDTNNNVKFHVPSSSYREGQDLAARFPFLVALSQCSHGADLQVYMLPGDSLVAYCSNFVDASRAHAMVEELSKLRMSSFLFGTTHKRQFAYVHVDPKPLEQKATSALAAEPLVYKRGPKKGLPKPKPRPQRPQQAMPPTVREVVHELETIMGLPLNKALVNRYRQDKVVTRKGEWTAGAGKECIPPHRDSENIFGKNIPIVSLSLQQRRRFLIQHERTGSALEFDLGQGDLLVMAGNTNRECLHWVPQEVERDIQSDRYNITFRSVFPRVKSKTDSIKKM